MALSEYRRKRNFKKTAEPSGRQSKPMLKSKAAFVVQKHSASHLHYDFRLQAEGVLKSWAVPKGPSMNPKDKRLAMLVEDHPLDYGTFEGSIPKGNYGAGDVIVWDRGTYELKSAGTFEDAFQKGDLKIILNGQKLRGEFVLARMKSDKDNTWLLIKKKDDYSGNYDALEDDRSVISGRRLADEKEIGKPGSLPHTLHPMLAKSAEKAFKDEDWIFEIKWDGYRAIAERQSGMIKLYSRKFIDFGKKYPSIIAALNNIPGDFVLDGEIVVLDESGLPNFQFLQDWDTGKKGILVYCIFDLLYKDGRTFFDVPLIERKEILRGLVDDKPQIIFSDYVSGDGEALFEAAKEKGLEGIMAKRKSSGYHPGIRSDSWLKIKSLRRQEAVVAGYTEPRGGRKHLGALILGLYEDSKFKYIGHTGGGFDDEWLQLIKKKLDKIKTKKPPFEEVPKTNAPVTWVKPEVVCEVKFQEWTQDGHMRQPIFLGLREDKVPSEVVREEISNLEKNSKGVLSDETLLKVTNLEKIYWPESGYTKGDLIAYYRNISSVILPYLEGRPQSMHRFPNGINGQSFFQKNVDHMPPDWVKTVSIRSESEDRSLNYLVCDDEPTLIYMANLGCIELNPWSSRVASLDNPDYVILDLDPDDIGFEEVIRAALEIKKILDKAAVPSYCKTSGATGLHILIPTGAKYDYEQARGFAEIIMRLTHRNLPQTTSVERNPGKRKGRIYLDYLQNRRGQTIASPYCVRPRPGAPVSTPLEWREVKKGLNPESYNLRTIAKRLDKKGDILRPLLSESMDLIKAIENLS